MRVLVTGSSGLIGSALVPFLARGKHEVIRLLRQPPPAGSGDLQWDPAAGHLNPADLEGLGGVVNLAGESILGRWTAAKKARLRASRVDSTRLLVETLARLQQPPKALVCASAIGYYGDRGDEVLREESPPGSSFLAGLARDWEAAAQAAAPRIRVVSLRIGVVLSRAGGALAQMLAPFKLGLGGRIGSGKQYLSWVSIDDLVGIIQHALTADSLRGPVNAVAPQAVTNLEFTKTLGRVLGRPTVFPMPAFAVRLAFGEMADELLLASARVEPARLQASGYPFHTPQLEAALRHLLGKTATK